MKLHSKEAIARILSNAAGWPGVQELDNSPKSKKKRLFAVVDASADPMIIPATIEAMTERLLCLYRGKALEEFGDDTAWVAELRPDEGLLDWLLDVGFGKRWAIFLLADLTLEDVVRHLRKLTLVQDEDGTHHFFRFYDPNTLRQYLPVLDTEQLQFFFRDILEIYLENNHAPTEILSFSFQNNDLTRTRHSVPAANIDRILPQHFYKGETARWS